MASGESTVRQHVLSCRQSFIGLVSIQLWSDHIRVMARTIQMQIYQMSSFVTNLNPNSIKATAVRTTVKPNT